MTVIGYGLFVEKRKQLVTDTQPSTSYASRNLFFFVSVQYCLSSHIFVRVEISLKCVHLLIPNTRLHRCACVRACMHPCVHVSVCVCVCIYIYTWLLLVI